MKARMTPTRNEMSVTIPTALGPHSCDMGAIKGSSFLILPGWLNWFTAIIAYHHVHHVSAKIPNYCLVACHTEYAHLFPAVTRVTLSQIPAALKYILWDKRAQQIISIAEHRQQMNQAVMRIY